MGDSGDQRTQIAPWSDLFGLAACLGLLGYHARLPLLFTPTIAAGGDTPCHYPTFVYFYEHLLPRLRFHGWYPGSFLGHPLLLYYFPFPFLVMSALAPVAGLPVAFKLGSVLGVFLLPIWTYVAFRWLGFRAPGPLFGATAATAFLLVEENPIWGGTFASTLTGEFAYTYGTGFALLFVAALYRAFAQGRSPRLPGVLLGLTAFAHGYAVLWAALSASYFLYHARRPGRTLFWLARVAAIAFALPAFWLLPLLVDWRWTTAYDDPWITATWRNLFPPALFPLLALAALGVVMVFVSRNRGGADRRLLYLIHAALAAAAFAAAGPGFGIIDVRFVPFAQLAAALLGAATLGLIVQRLEGSAWVMPLFVVTLLGAAHAQSRVVRSWAEYNYSGLQAKPLWPAFEKLSQELRGGVSDPRVAVEYSPEHEKAGSIRMYETLPHFSGRSTLEGVYNQASLHMHAMAYLSSELSETSPNPYRNIDYARFDTDAALAHLRLFAVTDIVALSEKLKSSLAARADVARVASIPPYAVFRLTGAGHPYVEPLRFEPVRSSPVGWRAKAQRWFTRVPMSSSLLVFTDDPHFETTEQDAYLPPPEIALPAGVEATATIANENIDIHTNRPGHPLLVKVSYHPRWKADGARGPFLVSPALMLVVPEREHVRLSYGWTWADWTGHVLALGALIALFATAARKPRAVVIDMPSPVALDACDLPKAPPRWGAIVPAAILLALVASRFLAGTPDHSAEIARLRDRAARSRGEGRYEAATAYASAALSLRPAALLKAELLCERGEDLLQLERWAAAAAAFERALLEADIGDLAPRALYGSAMAYRRAGDTAAEQAAANRLRGDYRDSPWADRLRNAHSP